MKTSIYMETTIISDLTSRPSRYLRRAAHQEATYEWWASRAAFDLYVSQLVVDEAAAGKCLSPKRVTIARKAS